MLKGRMLQSTYRCVLSPQTPRSGPLPNYRGSDSESQTLSKVWSQNIWEFGGNLTQVWTSLVAQTVKCLPTMQETRVRSLGGEDSPGEGNGNPLEYSCLENPMGEAW